MTPTNFVDIHSHVVWGVDDGAPTLEVSLEILEAAANAGTTAIVATPHSNGEYYYDRPLIEDRIAHLNDKMGGRIKIHRGCDLHLSFDNITEAIEDPKKFSIAGKQYILVEFSDFHISSSMDSVLERLLKNDLVPVLTHPERNPILQKDTKKIEKWMEQGCLVQVTALSVLGGFGKSAHTAAHKLLELGYVHVIASDAHDPVRRHARLDEAYAALGQRYGEDFARLVLITNPTNIVNGRLIADGPVLGAKRPSSPWWQFWS